jgi:hypothetical protein
MSDFDEFMEAVKKSLSMLTADELDMLFWLVVRYAVEAREEEKDGKLDTVRE